MVRGERNPAYGRALTRGLQQHHVSVKFQKVFLAKREAADIHSRVGVHAHLFQGWPVRNRRNDQIAVTLKANEAPIEEMINALS